MEFNHTPVMLNECINGLNIKKDGIGIYVDGTLGGAGHSKCIAQRLSEAGKLICIDRDERALEYSRNVLSNYNSCIFVHGNFSNLLNILDKLNINLVEGVLLDLGVSSYQLDTPERGFSYMHDAPLDMRMDKSEKFNAFDIVNSYSADRLNNIIFNYGEERWAKRIAEYIVKQRSEKPIETTFELVSVIKSAIPKNARQDGPHPAKRTFQAIRIEVNRELEILSNAIHDIVSGLKQGGRICVITFHSLEDRIIKNAFKELENPCSCPREFPVCMCGKKPSLRIISRKPILPSEQELSVNHRSRSAKLRIAEKL